MSKVIYDSIFYMIQIERGLCYSLKKQLFVMTAWEVAGEYVYTTPGDQDTDYLMLTLDVPGYR